jgi:2-polyprenyl-3-methyl-5-hydroxy-6-metoxy-1,4-benzoquinol methylase
LCGSSSAAVLFRLKAINILRCGHCQLTFSDFSPNDLSALYSDSYYQERKEYYFHNSIVDPTGGVETDSIVDFRRGLEVIESMKRPGRLLDLGCGPGIFLAMAQERGWDSYGVDVSEHAIDFAKRRFGIKAFAGQLKDAPFPSGSFDVVTLWDVVEHFPDPIRDLREVGRVLRDDGIILMNTPNADSPMRSLAWLAYVISGGRFRYPAEKLYHEYHLYYFSEATLTQLLAKAGFIPVQLTKKLIPITRARGTKLEKLAVRALAVLEKVMDQPYELVAVARKNV